jgi:hypothetical protein
MSKKGAKSARIIFHELLFALAIALFFVVLVLVAMGYRLRRDINSGLPVFERTALLRVGSYPTGANIILNGNDTGKKTTLSAQRLVISAGNYTLRVTKDGYHPWQNDFTAIEAEITWFDYLQLFPTNKHGDVVQSFESTNQVWQSPTGEHALALTPATKTASQKLNILSISATSTSNTAASLSADLTVPDLVVWAKDESTALLCQRKNTAQSTSATAADKCALVDVDHGRLSNLTLPIDKSEDLWDVSFVNSKTLLVVTSARAYLYDTTAKTSQKLDAKIPTTNLPDHLTVTTNDVTLLYYAQTSRDTTVTSYNLATVTASGALTTIYTNDTPFQFNATRYLNNFVLAVANKSRLKIYISDASSPFSSISNLTLQNDYEMPDDKSAITADGRFITTASGLAIDLERQAVSNFDNTCHNTTWQKLNSALRYCPDDNQLLIQDFDGTNRLSINLPNNVTMPAPTSALTDTNLPITTKPATIVNRRTLYYWTLEHVNDASQLQLRQLRL